MREKTATLPRPVPVAKLLALMDEFSYNTAFLISIGYDKAKIVRDLIREKKPKTFVELGGYLGYSALLVADAMKEYAPDAKVWSVELDSGCADKAEEFVRLAGLEKNIEFVRATGVDAVEKMQSKGLFKGVDMLFLDHVEDLYMQDFKFYLEKGVVGTGATVFADNVVRPGAPEYRKYVRGLKGVESKGVKGMITPGMFEVSVSGSIWAKNYH